MFHKDMLTLFQDKNSVKQTTLRHNELEKNVGSSSLVRWLVHLHSLGQQGREQLGSTSNPRVLHKQTKPRKDSDSLMGQATLLKSKPRKAITRLRGCPGQPPGGACHQPLGRALLRVPRPQTLNRVRTRIPALLAGFDDQRDVVASTRMLDIPVEAHFEHDLDWAT